MLTIHVHEGCLGCVAHQMKGPGEVFHMQGVCIGSYKSSGAIVVHRKRQKSIPKNTISELTLIHNTVFDLKAPGMHFSKSVLLSSLVVVQFFPRIQLIELSMIT